MKLKILFEKKSEEKRRNARTGRKSIVRSVFANKRQVTKISVSSVIEAVSSALIPVAFGVFLTHLTNLFLIAYVVVFGTQWALKTLFWVLMKAQKEYMRLQLDQELDATISNASYGNLKIIENQEAKLHSSQLSKLVSLFSSDLLFAVNSCMIMLFNIVGIGIYIGLDYMIPTVIGAVVTVICLMIVIKMNEHFSVIQKINDAVFEHQFNSRWDQLPLLQETGVTRLKSEFTQRAVKANISLYRDSEWIRFLVTGFARVAPSAAIVWVLLSLANKEGTDPGLMVTLNNFIITILPVSYTAAQLFLKLAENWGLFQHLGMVLNSPPRPEGKKRIAGIKCLIISTVFTLQFKTGGGLFPKGIATDGRGDVIFPQGRFYVICGPSGTGKSQLVKLLTRQLDNMEGASVQWSGSFQIVTLGGEKVELFDTTINSFYMHVHYCPQKPIWVNGLQYKAGEPYQPGSVRDNIGLTLLMRDDLTQRQKNRLICRAAKAVSLENKLDQAVETLSGGEQSRCSIARGLVGCMLNPNSVLVLDESLSSLDAKTAKRVLRAIRQHARRYQSTVIMVSHNHEINPSGAYAYVFQKRKGVSKGIVERGSIWRLRLIPWSQYNRVNERTWIARLINRLIR